MKNIKSFILPIIITAFLFSCSNDDIVTNNDTFTNNDNDSGDPAAAAEGNYFPSSTANYWKYNVSTLDNTTNDNIASQDSLYVVTETPPTLMLDVNDGLPANGPIIGLLSSGTLTKSNITLSLDGILELPAQLSDLVDFDIALNNFVLYNTEANINTQLASNTNTLTQDFNGFPLTIAYQLTSTALGFSESLMLNGTTYSNVVTSKLSLNLSVSTTINIAGIDFPLAILEPNDVLVSTNYYVEGIGLVRANSGTSYQISAAAITALENFGVVLPIPPSGSTTIDQIIDVFSVME